MNKLILRHPRPPWWRGSTNPGDGVSPFLGTQDSPAQGCRLRGFLSWASAFRVLLCLSFLRAYFGHRRRLQTQESSPVAQERTGSLDVRSPRHMSFSQEDGRLVSEAGAQPFRGRAPGPGFDSDTLPPSHPPLESVRLWELRELNPCPAQSFF